MTTNALLHNPDAALTTTENERADKSALTFSDAATAIGGGTPNSKGWVSGTCPAHRDSKASLGINARPDGTFAIKCQAGCTRKQVIAALEQKTGKTLGAKKKKERSPAERGLTLEQYADMKKLPLNYLTNFFQSRTEQYEGKPCVAHLYLDGKYNPDVPPDSNPYLAGIKYRLSTDSHDTFWPVHNRALPYGVLQYQTMRALMCAFGGHAPDWIVICEGESDTQTLLFAGVPVLGISGKNNWQPEFADLALFAQTKEIFIVQEPDAIDFVKAITPSFPEKKVYALRLPVKDPSELWLADPNQDAFFAAWRIVMDHAFLIHDGFPNTDTGNAERLVDRYVRNFRWLTDEENFCVWDGTIWQRSKSGDRLLPITKEIARAIPDPKWQVTSESSGKRKSMIELTKGENAALAESNLYDRHPMLLNVQNGTLDLERQTLRDFCREDFLTRKANVTFDPDAKCPKFDDFLKFIFDGDTETIHFVVKALGYTLTGNIKEHVFFICYGLGANGKTTLIEVLMQILGPHFALPARFTTFVHTKSLSEKYELATFKGKRLITAVEPRKAGHLDEEVLKQLTGGDQIMARNIYEKNVTFYPEFKLWLAMNNQPRIIGTDEGIWRRVRMLKFNVRIPDSKKVPEFHKVLFAEEGPGILNRLLEGLRDWREESLTMSGAVASATKEFRASQNVIEDFFDSCTLSGTPGWRTKAGDIYTKYKKWAEEQGEPVIRSNEFKEEMERHGFVEKRIHEGKHWFGITLKDAPEGDAA